MIYYLLIILNVVLATDFCADSIIKRDLSNTLYARTRDYDAAQRQIDQTAAAYFDMPLDDEIKYPSVTCQQLFAMANMTDGPDYIHVFLGMNFLTGYINDTNTTAPIYSPDYDKYQIANESRRLSSLNFMLPNILKSTAGGLSVWLIVGVKQLFISKIYADYVRFPIPEAACIFPQDMWDYYFLPYTVYLPQNKGTDEEPEWERVPKGWTRPTCDAAVNTTMTEYIYPLYRNESHVDTYYGQLILDLRIGSVFYETLYLNDPNKYGFNFLVSTFDYRVVGASDYGTKMLFDSEYNIDMLTCYFESTLNISTTGFSPLHELLQNPMIDNTNIHSTINNKDYYVTWVREDTYKYILVAAVLENVLHGSSWEIQTPSINYSSEEETEDSFIIVKNTGIYKVTFTLSTTSTFVILNDKYTKQLSLEPNKYLNITFRVDLTKKSGDSFTVTFIPNGDNYECYTSLLATVNLVNIDCVSNDYIYELSECNSNYRHTVHYKWKEDSICRGGISLPADEEIPCQWFNGNGGFIAYSCIVCGVGLVSFLFIGLKCIKHAAEVRAMEPIPFFICFTCGLIFLMICILVLCFGELNRMNCTVYQVFRTFGSLLIETTILCTLIQINTKFIKNNIIFIKDSIYLLEFLLPVLIVESIILGVVSPFYDEWNETINDKIIPMNVCKSSNMIKSIVIDIPIFLLFIVNIYYSTRIGSVHTRLGSNVLQVLRACSFSNILLIANPITNFITHNGFPDQLVISYVLVSECLLLILLLNALTPYREWILCRKNGGVSQDGKIVFTQVLNDPITRLYLHKHLQDLLQEENIIFWEAVMELKGAEGLTEECYVNCLMHIYKRFISENGDLEININDSMKKEITKEIEKGNYTLSIFDKAMAEIEELINVNAFYTFQSSAHFESAKTLMNWYNNYAKMEPQAQSAVFMKVMQDGIYISAQNYFINGFENPPVFHETATAGGGIQSAIVSFVSKGNPNLSRPPSMFAGTVKLSTHESSHNQSSSNDLSRQIRSSRTGTSPQPPPSRKASHVVQQYASANRISGLKTSMRMYNSNANSPRRSKVITPTEMPGAIPVTVSTPLTNSTLLTTSAIGAYTPGGTSTPVTNSFHIAPISENVLPPVKNSPNDV